MKKKTNYNYSHLAENKSFQLCWIKKTSSLSSFSKGNRKVGRSALFVPPTLKETNFTENTGFRSACKARRFETHNELLKGFVRLSKKRTIHNSQLKKSFAKAPCLKTKRRPMMIPAKRNYTSFKCIAFHKK